jgi:tricorn protease
LLVANPANESRPMYSPDGSRLAYVLHLGTGETRRITFDDAAEVLDGWSRDGRFLYFFSTAQDIGGMNDVFRVPAEGGTPMPVTADRFVAEYFSTPSPNGEMLAFTARGITSSQWWRHGHSHLDESEICVASSLGAAPKYELLQGGDFKCLWPMWSADGAAMELVPASGYREGIAGKDSQLDVAVRELLKELKH